MRLTAGLSLATDRAVTASEWMKRLSFHPLTLAATEKTVTPSIRFGWIANFE